MRKLFLRGPLALGAWCKTRPALRADLFRQLYVAKPSKYSSISAVLRLDLAKNLSPERQAPFSKPGKPGNLSIPWPRNLNFDIRARQGLVDRFGDALSYNLDAWPARRREHHDRYAAINEMLLVLQVRVRCHEHLEARRLRPVQQFPVLQRRPSTLVGGLNRMLLKQPPKRRRRTLVEEYSQSLGGSAARDVLKHLAHLLDCDAREPADKIVDRSAIFEVLEQRSDGHTRAVEDPRTTDTAGVLLDSRA